MPKKRLITHGGRTQSASAWALELGIKRQTILGRLRDGLPAAEALSTERAPPRVDRRLITAHGKTQSYRAWSSELGVGEGVLRNRIRDGIAPDAAMTRGRLHAAEKKYPESWEGSRDMPWDEDDRAWAMVMLCGRMTCAQIGVLMGLVRQRVQQIEHSALGKLGLDPSAPNLRALFRERIAVHDESEQTWPEPAYWGNGGAA